jgi:ABC-type glycerol-3-phosphate transport system substrate-binding protein
MNKRMSSLVLLALAGTLFLSACDAGNGCTPNDDTDVTVHHHHYGSKKTKKPKTSAPKVRKPVSKARR